MTDPGQLLEHLIPIARRAGEAILEIYDREDLGVQTKDDDSPLTLADLASHRAILAGLEALTPDIPVYSEESSGITWEVRRDWNRYWLVDPLDGTREFIKRNGEFTVNIALIEEGEPVLGVVHVPVRNLTYAGGRELGAFRQSPEGRAPLAVRKTARPVVMVASRSHASDRLKDVEAAVCREVGPVELTSMGSSLKLCLVAEGSADIYPRLGPTSEWDTAAADAVVRAAGGHVLDTSFEPLRYNKEDILNPHFLVIGSDPGQWRFLAGVL